MTEYPNFGQVEQLNEKQRHPDDLVAMEQGADLSRAGANADYKAMRANATASPEHRPQLSIIDAAAQEFGDKSKPFLNSKDQSTPGWHKTCNTEYHTGADGKIDRYDNNGDSVWQGKDGKWYETDSKGVVAGPMTEPKIDGDGNVSYTFAGREQWDSILDKAQWNLVDLPIATGAKILKELLDHSNWTLGKSTPESGISTVPPYVLPRWNPGHGPSPKSEDK
jgi:hypothetical protein